MNCQICNTPQKDDLFAAVTGEPVCSICKVTYVGGLPSTPARIALVREALGLQDGEFLKHDRGSAFSTGAIKPNETVPRRGKVGAGMKLIFGDPESIKIRDRAREVAEYMERMQTCETCNGRCYITTECPDCEGAGEVEIEE